MDPLFGEPWREVDPGRLPRSLHEINRGTYISAAEQEINTQQQIHRQESIMSAPSTQSIEQVLDELMEQDDASQNAQSPPNPTSIPSEPPTIPLPSIPGPPAEPAVPAPQQPVSAITTQLHWLQQIMQGTVLTQHDFDVIDGSAFTARGRGRGRGARGARGGAPSARGGYLAAQQIYGEVPLSTGPPTFSPIAAAVASYNPVGLDVDDRPKPLSDEQLTVKMACAICYTQRADIVFLPCGHVCTCQVGFAAYRNVPRFANSKKVVRGSAYSTAGW